MLHKKDGKNLSAAGYSNRLKLLSINPMGLLISWPPAASWTMEAILSDCRSIAFIPARSNPKTHPQPCPPKNLHINFKAGMPIE
jgi:hypothetical protein